MWRPRGARVRSLMFCAFFACCSWHFQGRVLHDCICSCEHATSSADSRLIVH
ncbi:hypothetical protein KC19_11G162000 [Ceratodon purpureus]|uniref:Secreted protein n=1 Tax=Ceratodon purpureus TaxID=3225 RepID=A0A8T0GHU1_CERPU|nr:hypothetical protein KC19_11G162000 [Ceratodon purpureus]